MNKDAIYKVLDQIEDFIEMANAVVGLIPVGEAVKKWIKFAVDAAKIVLADVRKIVEVIPL